MKSKSSLKSKTFPLGGIALLDKVEKTFGALSKIFGDDNAYRAKNFIGRVKLLLHNKLTHNVSVHRILDTYPEEVFEYLGIKDNVSERSLYRTLETIGKSYPLLVERYQRVLEKHGLIDKEQIFDFSSTYFEGRKAELSSYGYSRDHREDKKQITFGIATGISGIPTAITIQRGNVQDKKHFRYLLNLCSKILEENSLLIFDCGANSKANKEKIR